MSFDSAPNLDEQEENATREQIEMDRMRFLFITVSNFDECRERDSNPHSHFWPRDFKSLVSTNSTIAANSASTLSVTDNDPPATIEWGTDGCGL